MGGVYLKCKRAEDVKCKRAEMSAVAESSQVAAVAAKDQLLSAVSCFLQ
jgi:hypothetical protein